MIGDEVAVDVVEARPGTVRLRVIAPRSISVHRREVYDAIRAGEPQSRPRLNRLMTSRMLQWCRRTGCRLIAVADAGRVMMV